MPPTQQDAKPIILAVSSDHHAGSTVGLCPPVFRLDDRGDYKASTAQRWLWRNWLHYIGKVKATAAKHNTGYTAILDGDLIEGNHHHTVQVISNNETTQMRIAEEALKPLLEDADAAYFIRGTSAHVGQQARLEERIAENWTNTIQDGDNFTWRILHLDANGTRLNIAHHATIGRLPWTRANSLGKWAIAAELNGYRRYGKAPHVVIRAHNHQHVDSKELYPVRVIGLPAWQLVTGYVDRFDPDALADIGGLIFTCWPGGTYELETVRYQPRPTPLERIRS